MNTCIAAAISRFLLLRFSRNTHSHVRIRDGERERERERIHHSLSVSLNSVNSIRTARALVAALTRTVEKEIHIILHHCHDLHGGSTGDDATTRNRVLTNTYTDANGP